MALASEESPYWVRSLVDVAFNLNDLRKQRTPLSCELGSTGYSFTTEILAVDSDKAVLYLDAPGSTDIQQRIAQSAGLVVRSASGGVQIAFELSPCAVATLDGSAALRATLPKRLLKVQRRDFFRVQVPKSLPVTCTIPLAGAGPAAFAVMDVGLGGVALLSKEGEPLLKEGTTYKKSRLNFPDGSTLEVDIRVRHVASIKSSNRAPTRRYGCAFESLQGPQEAQLQRYVLQLERDRRAASELVAGK